MLSIAYLDGTWGVLGGSRGAHKRLDAAGFEDEYRAARLTVLNAPVGSLLRRTFQVTAVTYQLVLLPVWLALVQRDQKMRLALVNGQTGQVAVSSPLRSRSSGREAGMD